MKNTAIIKIAAILTAVVGLVFVFSPATATAQEEMMLAMLTKTDSLDEIDRAYHKQKVELTAVKKEKRQESLVNQMIQEVGNGVDKAASADSWPVKLLGYVPYEIMTGDYGGLFMRLAF